MAKNLFGLVHTMLDDSGALEPGGTIEVYTAGTSTARTVYSDRGLTTTAGSTITADAAGRLPERWIADAAMVKLVYKDSSGAVLATRDYANDNGDGLETCIATYAAARLLSGLTLGDVVYIAGRTSVGDGGEGWRLVIAGGTDNDGLVLTMADGQALLLVDQQEDIDVDIFGIVPGTVTAATFNSLVTAMSLQTTRTTKWRGGNYTISTKPAVMTTILRMEGAGESVTSILRGYSEGTASNGFLEYRDANASNGTIRDMQIAAGSATTGGTMVKLLATTTSAMGWPTFENVVISPGSGAYEWAFVADGLLNTTVGVQGIRSLHMTNVQCFDGGSGNSAAFYNVVNSTLLGLWANGNILISGGGTSTSNTQRLVAQGLTCLGTLTIENCDHVSITGTMDDVVINATAANVTIQGDVNDLTIASGATGVFIGRVAGVLTNNAPTTFRVISQQNNTDIGLVTVARVSVDLNSTSDQAVTLTLPFGFTRYRLFSAFVTNNSAANASSAVGGIYTSASKAGTEVVAAAQTYLLLTAQNTNQALTLSTAGVQVMTDLSLFFSLSTPAGVAATGELVIVAFPVT